MSKSKKVETYSTLVDEVPELEAVEDLVKQVLGMDIFDDLEPLPPYAEVKRSQKKFKLFKNKEKAKNALISVLLETTRQMNQKIARLCAVILDQDPKSPIALKYQAGRNKILKEGKGYSLLMQYFP